MIKMYVISEYNSDIGAWSKKLTCTAFTMQVAYIVERKLHAFKQINLRGLYTLDILYLLYFTPLQEYHTDLHCISFLVPKLLANQLMHANEIIITHKSP